MSLFELFFKDPQPKRTSSFGKDKPETPYGPKIASISNAGIEFYWKKVEKADGYEIFRSYELLGKYKKIGENNSRDQGEYMDDRFNKLKKKVYYKSRSYFDTPEGERVYSDFTEPVAATFRDEMVLERSVTYMYDGTQRTLGAFYGWGEVRNPRWSSSNSSVATVDSDGTIHAHTTGEAVITCESKSAKRSAVSRVVVNRASLAPLDVGPRRYQRNAANHWENPAAPKTNDAVIMMVGDLMCGSAQTRKQYTEENGWSYNDSFKFVKDTTAQSDFAVGNLETLMASGFPYMVDEAYIANKNNCNNPSRYLDAVLYGGFDAVTMSNNHNCDGGVRALLDTIKETRLRNIPHTGVFSNSEDPRYMIVDVRGIKVGFLAYMSRYTGFNGKDADWSAEDKKTLLNVFTKKRAIADIRNCRKAGAEYIIAYMHWGKKNYRTITKEQQAEAQAVADAGADYIVGANPHVVQVYDDITAEDGRIVPCFYSTGNFQAFMNQIPGNRDSVMVRIRLTKDASGKVTLAENNYIPYHIYANHAGCYMAPLAASKAYSHGVKVPGRKKYAERIANTIGNKVKAL